MGGASTSGEPKEWRSNSGHPGPKDPGSYQEPALVVNTCTPKILVVPYKPWAARVTDIGLLVPLYSGRLGIKGTCTGIMSTQHPEHCDGKPGLCGQAVLR